MADEEQKPPSDPASAADAAPAGTPADSDATPAKAAGDKPASAAPAEPLKGEVSRTDAAGAGASAAPPAAPRAEPPAPEPENPAAATTATTSETSSATGQPTAPASADAAAAGKPAAAAKPPAAAAAKPAAPASAAAATAGKPAVAKPAVAAGAKPAAPAAGAAAAPKAAAPKAAPHPPPAPAPPSGPTEPPPPADMAVPAFITTLQNTLAGSVTHVSYYIGDWTIVVPVARSLEVARHLRDTPDALFDFCSDVTATDWPPRKDARFDVIYCLYSTRHHHRIRVKLKVGEQEGVPSVTGIWPAANWLEREVYDMFGVLFTGHPDRRRILMPDDWQGFPQRKDYPLEGPGELLMENPEDWLKLRQARQEADIE